MRVESGIMPQSFKVETVGKDAFVTFAENVMETPVEEGVRYEYDAYTLKCRASSTLEKRVHENYGMWLARAKASQPEPEPTAEEVLADLIQLLVDKEVIY